MIEFKLYATNPTDLITQDGSSILIPSGFIPFRVECQTVKCDENSDILIIRKELSLPEGRYSTESRFSAAELLDALPSAVCRTQTCFFAIPGLKLPQMLIFAESITIYEDSRDVILFALQQEADQKPVLCKLWQKYYSASVDLKFQVEGTGSLRRIYGILHTNVTLCSLEQEALVEPGTAVYFSVPERTLLWNNTAVIAEEDGHQYRAQNGVPVTERWKKT